MGLGGALVAREHVPFKVIGTPPANVVSLRLFPWIATSIFLFLSTVSLLARFHIRLKLQGKMRLEDYLILPGYIIALMPAICIYVLLETGFGYHMANLEPATIKHFLKADFALQRANQPALAFIKISILVFYMGIFPTRGFKIAAYVNIVYTLLWAVVGWCINLTVCHPVSYFYDRTTPGGYCGSQQVSGAINGGLGVLGDVCILVLPIFMIHRLQLNFRKKVAVSGIFLLGAFVCIASGLRIWAVSLAPPQDVTFAQVTASTWTAIEMQVAILSANLPTLAPLFEHLLRNRKNSRPSGGEAEGRYNGSSGGAGSGAGGQRQSGLHIKNSEHSLSTIGKGGGVVTSTYSIFGGGSRGLGRVLGRSSRHDHLSDDDDDLDTTHISRTRVMMSDDARHYNNNGSNSNRNNNRNNNAASSDDDYSYGENTSDGAYTPRRGHAVSPPSQGSSSDIKALNPQLSHTSSQGSQEGSLPGGSRHGRHRGFERIEDDGLVLGQGLGPAPSSHMREAGSLGMSASHHRNKASQSGSGDLEAGNRKILVKTELSAKVEPHKMSQKDKDAYELRVINGWQR